MSIEETRGPVPATEALRGLMLKPLPEGTEPEGVFLMAKLDNGEWSVRTFGPKYNRSEFLGQLIAYTHALKESEAQGWFDESDED